MLFDLVVSFCESGWSN